MTKTKAETEKERQRGKQNSSAGQTNSPTRMTGGRPVAAGRNTSTCSVVVVSTSASNTAGDLDQWELAMPSGEPIIFRGQRSRSKIQIKKKKKKRSALLLVACPHLHATFRHTDANTLHKLPLSLLLRLLFSSLRVKIASFLSS